MAISVRKNVQEFMEAMAFAFNAMQSEVVTDGYHRDLTQYTTPVPVFAQASIVLTQVTVSAANATTLATLVTLTNNLLGVLNTHMLDAQAHLKADVVNAPTVDGYNQAVDLPSCEVLLNAMKLLFTAHLTQSGVHPNNDTTVYGLPTNAVDETTSQNLANAMKTAVNTHMANAGSNFNIPRLNLIAD
jgi:hypothetical protein